MASERLRSRTGATPAKDTNSRSTSSSNASEDKKAMQARLKDRRRTRREQRLQGRKTSSNLNGSRSPGSTFRGNPAFLLIVGALLLIWLFGFYLLQKTTSTTSNTNNNNNVPPKRDPMQFLRRVGDGVAHNLHLPSLPQPSPDLRQHMLDNGAPSKNVVVHGDPNHVIDMREINAHLTFDNVDGGAWKQGWDVQPVSIGANERPLRVFVVPHSHCDPGWIKTFDQYFQTQTKQILSSVIEALHQNPKRKFIWAEISYFEWWWREQTPATQEGVKQLLRNKQFEFVTGGWVQPDEANTQLYAMEIQLQEGHDFIRNTFGEEYIPKYGWSIDPFGYSPTMAYLLKKHGFQAMLIQRVHYRIKKELAQSKSLEFMWRQTWDDNGDYDIFTHAMPFYSYDIPHTCGPDPSVCCQFDFARRRGVTGYVGNCPWGKQPQSIHPSNVKERALLLLDQYRKKANLYQSNVVIAPLGDDFRYRTLEEANEQYTNYQLLFDYINENVDGVEISFGTLSEYFQAAMGTFTPPLLKGSFFTYSDRDQDYWSGYFTSRIFDKALDRVLERVLYAATTMGATKLELQEPRRALSLFQHHDGVTGTAKTHVVEDYAAQIHKAIRQCNDWIVQSFLKYNWGTLSGLQPCWQSDAPRGLSQNLCGSTGDILVYNPLEIEQSCGNVKVPGGTVMKASLPCEIPGAIAGSKAGILFDAATGLMTHPVKEEWKVWKVPKGGAYLFFPGVLDNFQDKFEIINGGWEVRTPNWKRTVIERSQVNSDGHTVTVIDFTYETFLQNGNEEWLVRFHGDIDNKGVFHTDLNGYNFDTHHFRSDMPIQSQVFPMPTHAAIEDSNQRLTILSEHAQGTASLQEGSIDVWLDRRLRFDDERGVGQGVLDNVPSRTRLRVVLETGGFNHNNPEFEITPFCKQMWKELNHPLELFGRLEHDALQPIPGSITEKVNKVRTRKHSKSSTNHVITPVYMVFNRVDYLKRAIDSLRDSDFPRTEIPIIISYDGHFDSMLSYVDSIKSDFHVIELFHPHACSEHPDSFPGDDPKLNEGYPGDKYGNPREAKITCCKHHFTWMLNTVFAMDEVEDSDGFLFLEEDYVVAPNVYETIQTALTYIDLPTTKTSYFGVTLDLTEGFAFEVKQLSQWGEKRFVTGPMVIRRDMFKKIQENAKEYCTFDEYNWDWSLVHLMGNELLPHLVLVPMTVQAAHIGVEGGLHESGITQQKLARMGRLLGQSGKLTTAFHASVGHLMPLRKGRKVHNEGFGGWGHPADHEHCLNLFKHSG
eukprot:Nitzschia sp. Nitz4//scaffold24_size164493//109468//113379//NITZ4_002339-RA/size164493-snap-gene-0.16-mRNA-1//-1//CDS//3329544147//6035//frame0